MKIVQDRKKLEEYRLEIKGKLAFVPTMGALHAGHLSLVKRAQELAETVVVSIFVNPLQFAPNEDLDKYPKTLESDIEKLEALNVDYLFAPDRSEIYPREPAARTLAAEEGLVKQGNLHQERINANTEELANRENPGKERINANPKLANKLCGLSRPGHFDGVCTVVKILFDLVQPDYAVFGEKDFQQLTIIQDMTQVLKLKPEIIPVPTLREDSGLAMSSRNQYLSTSEKEQASALYQELESLSKKARNLELHSSEAAMNNPQWLENLEQSKTKLKQQGFRVEYLETCWDRILVAAKLGNTRLIDNISL